MIIFNSPTMKKSKVIKNDKLNFFKSIIKKYLDQSLEFTQKDNQEYQCPQFVVDMCKELNRHLKLSFDTLLNEELKCSISQDYLEAFSQKCLELSNS